MKVLTDQEKLTKIAKLANDVYWRKVDKNTHRQEMYFALSQIIDITQKV